MKKLIFIAFFLMAGGVVLSFAGNAGLFDYNPATIDNEMAQLSQLEGFLLQHPGATLDEMVATGNPLASFVSHPDGVSNFDLVNEKALGIPGFLWGCCLSWVGILVVYLVADDPHETKMAIIGCVVNALLSGVSYGGYYWSLSRSYY